MSTFHGLEMARQALATQQAGLYITGHNISNINTNGYSRQRVNFETLSPYPSASRNRPQIPGQLGTGVQAGNIERMRDGYLDAQYRTQNSLSEYWSTKNSALSRMESLMNEYDGSDGLSNNLDSFWNSLQDLSTNPKNIGSRKVVIQSGRTLAQTFNYLANSLETVRSDIKTQIYDPENKVGKISDANSLLRQINALNKQIGDVEPHGLLPNDLYDQRDRLIDELSSIVNIKVRYEKTSGSLDIADGIAEIELVGVDGPVKLLTAADRIKPDNELKQFSVDYTDNVANIKFDNNDIDIMKVEGSLKALVENYGYKDGAGKIKGHFINMLNNLDEMAVAFAEAFNKAHGEGYDLNGNKGREDFFVTSDGNALSAKNIEVNDAFFEDSSLLAASGKTDDSGKGISGDGSNALKLGNIITDPLKDNALGSETSVKGFYQGIVGEMAVIIKESENNVKSHAILKENVQNQRLSVSVVSLDDEITNLLRFQHAYNASARSLTTMDELLDKIINSMGLVGR